ncbi:methionine-R-sulfoxide reductase [Thecamonas trahens ATCC 50062]|uniref:Peptide-methionine (R)-S-oxide reductase n=1 Tax=Thecamonas trahens ATCC 50062 TaxID=461836 RepID=A0A0L0D390_THETB|nr:methionine-R-sulfoxide reductase [Thecamonas trahens ATCC 50062]KNC46807.1 methionine-R-sulfoxide reductase [Thecamonas trahens ATCC 50062]|eukprot:XP_013760082.1 methionine-R-sulfoxide reductase [Thecamonas trahens ATCC 50062]
MGNQSSSSKNTHMSAEPPSPAVVKSDEEWRAELTPEQYRVLRKKGTERAGTGEYNKHFEEGTYLCAGCETPLYEAEHKFDSGCGWPAFYDSVEGAVARKSESFPDTRTEILCSACGGHIGHVFAGEGFKTPTNERHCANSVSLKFKPKAKGEGEGEGE